MLQSMLKSKLHRARITDANLNYEGSLTIDRELMDEVGLIAFEKVKVYNVNNGERFDTYVIEGPSGSRTIALNGAAARKGLVDDRIIIVSYALYDSNELDSYKPSIVVLDDANNVKKRFDSETPPPSK